MVQAAESDSGSHQTSLTFWPIIRILIDQTPIVIQKFGNREHYLMILLNYLYIQSQ